MGFIKLDMNQLEKYQNINIDGQLYLKSDLVEDYSIQEKFQNKKLHKFLLEWISDTPTIRVNTSGSTGIPKTIKLDKVKMVESALRTGSYLNLKKNDRSLLCLPIDFIAGKMMVVRAFVLGLNLILVKPKINPLEFIDEKFDFMAMTPMQVYNTLQSLEGEKKLNNIKNLIVGGGEINNSLLSKIQNLKNATYQTYGMTETITHIAMRKLNGSNRTNSYIAMEGVSFSLDKRGCLIIDALYVSKNRISTNDLVDLKNKFEFEFIGRLDNIINSGGLKISPEKIENMLSSLIKHRFVILGVPDVQLGQKVVIVIEKNKKEELKIDFSKSGLSKYEIPKQIYSIDCFPETKNGKIIRSEIAKLI